MLMQSLCCMCLSPTIKFQSLWNLVCTSILWRLIPSQRRTSWMPPASLCVCICIPLSFLGKNVTAATNEDASMEELLDAPFVYGQCLLKGSRRLVCTRPCFIRHCYVSSCCFPGKTGKQNSFLVCEVNVKHTWPLPTASSATYVAKRN
jgi:hypothetical protein